MTAVPLRSLVVTDDADLLDDLLRLAAASCVDVDVAPDPIGARASWAAAPLVVVGASVGAECARARLPRRSGVVLAVRGRAPDRSCVDGGEPPGGGAFSGGGVSPGLGGSPGSGVADGAPGDDEIWRMAGDLGAEHVVFLPAAESWLVDRFADAAAPSGAGRVVGVVGGRGGAGASVLAAALAVTATRQGLRPLLLDADPLGGGLDLVLGREETAGLRWPDLVGTSGRVSAPAFFDALPRVGELCVLSWDRSDTFAVPVDAVDAAIDAGRRGSDLVVVDLPRWPDEAAVHALHASDLVLVVVPAEVRACAAAARVVAMIGPHCARLRCVVRGPAPAGLRSRDLAAALALPLAGILRPEPGLAARLERGEAPAGRGRGPLAELCRQILVDLDNLSSAA